MYAYESKPVNLVKGTGGPEIIKLQKALNEIGYSAESTGLYDEATFQNVMRFQADFGLMADGIVGPRTRGLLYQVSD